MKIDLSKPEFKLLMEIVSLGKDLAKKGAKKNPSKYDGVITKLRKYEAMNASVNTTALLTNPHGAALEKSDIRLFFKLYLGLIHGVNEIKKVIPSHEKQVYGKPIDFNNLIAPVREKMWQNPDWITEYLEANSSEFSDEEARILQSWKDNFVSNRFIAVKHYKNCTILLGDEKLYAVRGISNSLQETYPVSPPYYLSTVLIPFKGRIIYDSIFYPYQIRFGGNMKASLNQEFKEIVAKHGIIETLDS